MATPNDWIWVTLTQAHLDLATRVAELELENVKTNNLGGGRFVHPKGDLFAKRIGAEGEIAFHLVNNWPLPSAETMASSYNRPDAGKYAIKTRSKIDCELIFEWTHLHQHGFTHFVLLYNASPRVALVGFLHKDEAFRVSEQGQRNGRNCFIVQQAALQAWPRSGEPARMPAVSELRW